MSIVILREKSPKFRRLEAQNPHFFFWFVGKNQLLEDYLPAVYLRKEKKKKGEQKAGKKEGEKREGTSKLRERGEKRKDSKGKIISVTDSKSNYKRQWDHGIA